MGTACPHQIQLSANKGFKEQTVPGTYGNGTTVVYLRDTTIPTMAGEMPTGPGGWPCPVIGLLPRGALTSSTVSSCGVAALSSESFCEPASALLRTSLLFLCLCASFFTCPSALPLLSRRTGLVSHLRSVFPGRLGPGELWAPIMWGWREATEAGGLASLLETDRESAGQERQRRFDRTAYKELLPMSWWCHVADTLPEQTPPCVACRRAPRCACPLTCRAGTSEGKVRSLTHTPFKPVPNLSCPRQHSSQDYPSLQNPGSPTQKTSVIITQTENVINTYNITGVRTQNFKIIFILFLDKQKL